MGHDTLTWAPCWVRRGTAGGMRAYESSLCEMLLASAAASECATWENTTRKVRCRR